MEHHDREALDGAGPYARERETLIPVSSLESWTLSDGEPDIRGWAVRTVSGRSLGTVSDLLVDGQAGEVVILDIGLVDTSRHTFVPVRVVHIERSKHIVMMDSADLPRVDVVSAERASAERRADLRPIRYREVPLDRPREVDAIRHDASVPNSTPDDAIDQERRRVARRRIDRMSTEF